MKKGDTSVKLGLNAVGNEVSLKAPFIFKGSVTAKRLNWDSCSRGTSLQKCLMRYLFSLPFPLPLLYLGTQNTSELMGFQISRKQRRQWKGEISFIHMQGLQMLQFLNFLARIWA